MVLVATIWGVHPRPTKEGVIPFPLCESLLLKKFRTRLGLGYLTVSSSFGIQEGRNFSPGRAWKRGSLSKVQEKRST